MRKKKKKKKEKSHTSKGKDRFWEAAIIGKSTPSPSTKTKKGEAPN